MKLVLNKIWRWYLEKIWRCWNLPGSKGAYEFPHLGIQRVKDGQTWLTYWFREYNKQLIRKLDFLKFMRSEITASSQLAMRRLPWCYAASYLIQILSTMCSKLFLSWLSNQKETENSECTRCWLKGQTPGGAHTHKGKT